MVFLPLCWVKLSLDPLIVISLEKSLPGSQRCSPSKFSKSPQTHKSYSDLNWSTMTFTVSFLVTCQSFYIDPQHIAEWGLCLGIQCISCLYLSLTQSSTFISHCCLISKPQIIASNSIIYLFMTLWAVSIWLAWPTTAPKMPVGLCTHLYSMCKCLRPFALRSAVFWILNVLQKPVY